MSHIEPKSIKSFYFLEYFYVLLKSIERDSDEKKVYDSFKVLEQQYLLRKSRSKNPKSNRDRYTFEQIIEESMTYKLIMKDNEKKLSLTKEGKDILKIYAEEGKSVFNKAIFKLMEQHSQAIRYLVELCYRVSPHNGLLIFPMYSPRKLGIEKATLKTGSDIIRYSQQLLSALQNDIRRFLGKNEDLSKEHQKLIKNLQNIDHLIPEKGDQAIDPKNYKPIMRRFRNFWFNVFLKELYQCKYSFTAFDVWLYRAKQVGLLHVTEYYPNTSGRLVYPTSIISDSTQSEDFEEIFKYSDGLRLFVHHPLWNNEHTQEQFVKALTNAYLDIRKIHRTYFVNLADVRELVCYALKISESLFGEFLEKAYKQSITDQLTVKIALEADKLPQETNAMYLKRSPVMVDSKYRNIIAIDMTRGGR